MTKDRPISDWLGFHGPLDHPLSEMSRLQTAPVEADHDLVEVGRRVPWADVTVIGPDQNTLEQREQQMRCGQVFMRLALALSIQ